MFKKLTFFAIGLAFAGMVVHATPSSTRSLTGSQIVNGSATLTLPSSTDTLTGRATTDTLTNKTLTTPKIGVIKDSSANSVVDVDNQKLKQTGGNTSIDWKNQYLYDNTSASAVIGWYQYGLVNGSGSPILNANARVFYDSSGVYAEDFQNRYLYDSSANIALKWGTYNSLQLPGYTTAGVLTNDISGNITSTVATNANTASAIVKRDGSGNFSAGTISANLTGSVTGNVTGNVTGTAGSFTGNLTGDVTSTGMSTSISGLSRSKLASGTASHVIINDGSGVLSSEAQLAITRGGTGQSTANAALNALLPSQASANGLYLKSDGSNTSWASPAGSAVSVVSKTSNYTLTTSDDIITVDSSGGAFAITLPNANASTGKTWYVVKVDSSTNAVTFTYTQGINGTTTGNIGGLRRQYDSITIRSTGTEFVTNQVASVASQAGAMERIERARIANNGTSSVTSQSGSWISSTSRTAAGDVTITINTGVFSGAPACTCSADINDFNSCNVAITSATSIRVRTGVESAGVLGGSDKPFNIICMGSR